MTQIKHIENGSCVEEKEKWNDSYVAGGFAEDSFEEKDDVFCCKLIIGLVLSLKGKHSSVSLLG